MWAGLVTAIINALAKLGPLLLAWKAGSDRQKAVDLEKGLEGLDRASKAVDDVRRDPVARDELRDRYRSG